MTKKIYEKMDRKELIEELRRQTQISLNYEKELNKLIRTNIKLLEQQKKFEQFSIAVSEVFDKEAFTKLFNGYLFGGN